MNRCFTYLAFMLSLTACHSITSNSHRKIGESYIADTSYETIPIDIGDDKSIYLFDSIIESVEVIPLETTAGNLIGTISKVIEMDDKYIVADYNKAKSIFVFDKTGKFLNRIGRRGEGKGEYSDIHQMAIDNNGNLMIVDLTLMKILSFTTMGELISEQKMHPYITEICPLSDSTFLLFSGSRENPHVSDTNYGLMHVDKNMEVKDQWFEYPKSSDIINYGVFNRFNDTIHLWMPMFGDNFIYEYKNGKIFCVYKFDFKGKQLPVNFLDLHPKVQDQLEQLSKLEYCNLTYIFETESFIYFTYTYKGNDAYWGIYNKKKHTSNNEILFDHSSNSLYIPIINSVSNNHLISIINPQEMSTDMKEIKKSSYKMVIKYNVTHNMSEDDKNKLEHQLVNADNNPVLLVYKLNVDNEI